MADTVIIEAFYTLILLLTLYCLAQHICDAVKKVLILIEEGIIKRISYERRQARIQGGGIWGTCPPPLSQMPNEKIYGD